MNWRGVKFKRVDGAAWELWPTTSNPSPPPQSGVTSIDKCRWDQHSAACSDWRGVHFIALSYDGQVWDRIFGWQCIDCGGTVEDSPFPDEPPPRCCARCGEAEAGEA